MEIVQTCTSAWPWCMSMFGARFAVFVRRARVLSSPFTFFDAHLITVYDISICSRNEDIILSAKFVPGSLVGVNKTDSQEERRPKLLETGAVGRVQVTKENKRAYAALT